MRRGSASGFIVLSVVCVEFIYAAPELGTRTRGVYGSVDFGYMQDKASDPVYNISQTAWNQRYTLGMRGSIYSPKLLQYLLQGSFLIRDVDVLTNGNSMESSTKQENYLVTTNFLQASQTPVSFSLEKTSNPYSSVQSGTNYNYYSTTDRYGVDGSFNSPAFNLNYRASNTDTTLKETFSDETRHNKEYGLSMTKTMNDISLVATFSDMDRAYDRSSKLYGYNTRWQEHLRDARIAGTWKVDTDLYADSALTYRESSYGDTKTFGANANVMWNPKPELRTGASVQAMTMSGGGVSTDTLMGSTNATYRLSQNVSVNGNLMVNQVNGDSFGMSMQMGTGGINYNRLLDNNWSVMGQANVSLKNEQFNYSGNEMGGIPNRVTHMYTISAGASKQIEALRSNFSSSVSYQGSESTLDEKTSRVSANASLITRLDDTLANSLTVFYNDETNGYYASNTEGIVRMDYEMMTINEMLRYTQKIGMKGNASLAAGFAYTRFRSPNRGSYDRMFPRIDGTLSYQFLPTLMFNSSASVAQDSVNDLTNYSVTMGLNYTLRKIVMSLGGRYLYQSGYELGDRRQSSVYANVSRPF